LWAFDEARDENDIRFVQVIDSAGRLLAQDDQPLGEHQAGSHWAEIAQVPLPDDLPPGTYQVYTGWYTYPDLVRFPVLADVDGAQAGLLAEFTAVYRSHFGRSAALQSHCRISLRRRS